MSTQTKREAFERGLEKADENPSILEITSLNPALSTEWQDFAPLWL
jgi:hypothetical protein